jgi:hypothetical protein
MISDLEFFRNEILGILGWSDDEPEPEGDLTWARNEIKRLQKRNKPSVEDVRIYCHVHGEELEILDTPDRDGELHGYVAPCTQCLLTKRAVDGARFCPECHALLEDHSVYCDTCGTDTPRR